MDPYMSAHCWSMINQLYTFNTYNAKFFDLIVLVKILMIRNHLKRRTVQRKSIEPSLWPDDVYSTETMSVCWIWTFFINFLGILATLKQLTRNMYAIMESCGLWNHIENCCFMVYCIIKYYMVLITAGNY